MSSIGTVLITGATDGIGLALAHYYRSVASRIILLGRRPFSSTNLTAFKPDDYCQVDLSQSNCDQQVKQWLDQRGIRCIDLLIHNAGLGYHGPTADQPADNIEALVAVNLWAPLALSHTLWPYITREPKGKIVFISSVVSALACPEYAVYGATKAALDGLGRNLQLELQPEVTIQLIHPGATRTGMHAKSGLSREVIDWEKFPPAARVARQIAASIERRQPTATIGLTNRLLRVGGRYFSGILDRFWRNRYRQSVLVEGAADKGTRTQRSSVKRCVITGAADGIGKALARQFATAGYQVIGIDFNARLSEQTRSEFEQNDLAVSFIMVDLRRQPDIDRVLEILDAGPAIDLFVHNAGINAVGRFDQLGLQDQRAVIELNLLAPLLLTGGLLHRRKFSPHSSLIFISSLSHFVSYPGAAAYAAAKDGLASYARSLSVALADQDIHVLTVYPGPTRTAHARRYSPDNSRENRRMSPEQLAAAIFKAARARRHILIPGFGNKVFSWLGLFLPGLTGWVMRRVILDNLDP